MKKTIFIFCSALVMPLVMANDLLIIGIKKNGEEQVYQTKTERVEEALLLANKEKQQLVLEVLEKNRDLSEWRLSQFSLGLGLEGEAGIGPWNLGLAIKQRIFVKRESKGAL